MRLNETQNRKPTQMKSQTKKPAALYARYSTDLQSDRSIEDQFAECGSFAERNGFHIVERGEDRAKTSATLIDRDGLLGLLRKAKEGKFKALVVENLDRVARDTEDLHHVYKTLKFHGVEIHTMADGGAVSDMHVGFRGMMGEQFLAGLKRATRRGLRGRVTDGLFAGGRTFGYRAVEGKTGAREIDNEQAEIVRRIFREYVNGASPRAIALGLTRNSIIPPSGKKGAPWGYNCILGGGANNPGIIGNLLYVGKLVYGRRRTVINPETKRAVRQPAPSDEAPITIDMPQMRIVDQALWDRAQAVRASRAVVWDGKVQHRPIVPRQNYLLSGILRCGSCHGAMRVQAVRNGKARFACGAALANGSCGNRQSFCHDRLLAAVLDHVAEVTLNPTALEAAARGYQRRNQELAKQGNRSRADLQKRLGTIDREIKRLYDLAQFTEEPVEALAERLKPLRREQVQITEQLRLAQADRNVVELHPKTFDQFRGDIETIRAALAADGLLAPDEVTSFRNLIDAVVVQPRRGHDPYSIVTYGRMDKILGGGPLLNGPRKFDNGMPGKAGNPVNTVCKSTRNTVITGCPAFAGMTIQV